MPYPPSTDPLTPIYILDGGLGTTLSTNHSIEFTSSQPLWSSHLLLTSPNTLLSAQRSFVDAGADVLLTATYQASFEGFERSGVEDRKEAGRVIRSAVGIARAAFDDGFSEDRNENGDKWRRGKRKGKVALGLGAYGAAMIPAQEYTGQYDENHASIEQLRKWHLERIKVFMPERGHENSADVEEDKSRVWEDVDFVTFETLPLLKEVEAVRIAMADTSRAFEGRTEKPFWITCVFPGKGDCLPDGSTVKDIVSAMLKKSEGSAIPMGIGVNCTKLVKIERLTEEFEIAVQELVGSGKVERWPSLVVYPDGTDGEVYNTTTKIWEQKENGTELPWDETLFGIITKARQRNLWKSIYVGGCCKTTPVDVEKLCARIKEL